jgi:hypothetical protein
MAPDTTTRMIQQRQTRTVQAQFDTGGGAVVDDFQYLPSVPVEEYFLVVPTFMQTHQTFLQSN